MLPCLRGGVRLALRDRRLQRIDQHRPRAPRLDHVVDVAALGGGVRVREALAVVGDQLGAPRLGVVGLRESLRKMMLTAPSGPITATSAVGHAKLKSARTCFELMTSYAPP